MKRELTDFEVVRAQELLSQRATEGLADDEQDDLEALGAAGVEGFEVAAAAIDLATLPREPLPRDLADKVFAAAMEAVGGRVATGAGTAPAVPAVAALLPAPSAPPRVAPTSASTAAPRRNRRIAMLAGWVTAAAAASLAAGLWFTREQPQSIVAPASARSELIATVDDVVTSTWVAGTDPTAQGERDRVTGDVVWSARRQRGYVRLRALPPNQPSIARYQLWIFDRERDQRYPVDGGLFDASRDGETVVEIQPRLPIAEPTQFMITSEGPTGAVVSDRSRVIATAQAR